MKVTLTIPDEVLTTEQVEMMIVPVVMGFKLLGRILTQFDIKVEKEKEVG